MLFIRAKKALEKQLSRNGLGKGTLLAALALFGKITAPSEAAASQIVVTTATANAGVLAGVVTLATGKTAVVAIAAGALSVGTVVLDPLKIMPGSRDTNQKAVVSSFGDGGHAENTIEKSWFYLPDGVNGPLIMRSEADTQHNAYKWVIVQDDENNYYYDGQTVHINNHRAWSEKTLRLATDSRALSRFLTKVDSYESPFEPVSASGPEVLVSAIENQDGNLIHPAVERRGSVLDEPFFLSDWPADAKIVDHRDAMHKRGWTYFRVSGQVQGRPVAGYGRVPFVYAALKNNKPYLTLRVGNLSVADTAGVASVFNRRTSQACRFPSGTFFQGLGRPWMGLHTLDCIRRDAADMRIPFDTLISDDQLSAKVTVQMRDLTLDYTVDLDDDLLVRIDMSQGERSIGVLEFSYLQDLSNAGVMETPSVSGGGTLRRDVAGPVWLEHLAYMTFFQD
jgi:hypothetical protein